MLNITAKTLHSLAKQLFSFYMESDWENSLFSAIEIGIIKRKVATVEDVRRWDGCDDFDLPFEDANLLETGDEYYVVCSEKEIEKMLQEKRS